VVPLLLSDGCRKAELHIATAAITAAIPVLLRITGDEEMAFIVAHGMALEALRLVRKETGTAYPALPE
jgi:hypothetical protein